MNKEGKMATTNTPVSDILEGVVQRNEYLQCVVDGPRKKTALADDLDVSRSTVDRATSKLEAMDLVESCDQGYQTTALGKSASTGFADLVHTVDEAHEEREITRGSPAAIDVVKAVIRRTGFLGSLLEAPKDKRELVEELGMSRSTVDRAVRELETEDLIEYKDGGFVLTPFGQLTASGLFELIDTIELRQQLDPFLRWVPDGTLGIDIWLLADADLLVAEPGDPWSMINKHVELVKTMDNFRALLPFTGLHAHEAAHEQVIEHNASVELVVEPDIAEVHMSNTSYAELTEEMIATGRVAYFEYAEEFPYPLVIIDDTVQIVVSEGDEPRALLETDSPEVRDWAEGKYDEYKQQSEKLT